MDRTRKSPKIIMTLGLAALIGTLAGCGQGDGHVAEGMRQVRELDYKEALKSFEEARAGGEDLRLIERGQGIAYMGLTDYDHAIACFEAALRSSDGFVQDIDYDLNYYLAAAYTKNGQLLDAETVYSSMLAMKAKEKEACFLRGTVRLNQGNYEGAKEDFDTVVSLEPANYDRLIEIYQALWEHGYKEVGQQYLKDCMDQYGKKMSNFDTGRMYYYLEDYQKAYVELEKAREKGGAESYLYLGKAHEATGEYTYALSVYNSWIAKDTQSAEIYNQLGLCEMAIGDYPKALEAFEAGKQIENNSMMQALCYNEIVTYEYLQEYEKANVLLKAYLKNYPDDENAKREQIFLSTR